MRNLVWRLKRGGDRRVRAGHPWVFAGELANSPRDARPGDVIELRDDRDHFVAYGYGHPTANIAFRRLSTSQKDADVLTKEYFVRRLSRARAARVEADWAKFSHRWLFAEADGVPGLVIDAFRTGETWAIVAQASTAGIDRAMPAVFEALETFAGEFGGAKMTLIEAPSSRARLAEGLEVGPKRVVRGPEPGQTLDLVDGVTMTVDLIGGQKTGFFLDQQWNAQLLKRFISRPHESVRVLDVCAYVGQWATHATHAYRALGSAVHVTLADVSAAALDLAEANVRAAGAESITRVEADVLESLGDIEDKFDLVICDPPAFVKKKADLEPGLRAYVKLNRDAMKLCTPGGLFVASSCSGVVKVADYQTVVAEASRKAGRSFRHVATGGHAPDHPVRPDFPEGEYLKCSFGRVEYPF